MAGKKVVHKKWSEEELDKLLGRQRYDAARHCKQIVEVMKAGRGISAFTSSNNICRDTFYRWMREHPELAAAYKIAKEHGEQWYEKKAIENLEKITTEEKDGDHYSRTEKKLDTTLWSMIMRNRFGYTEHRRVGVAGLAKIKLPETKDGHAKRFNKLIDAMAEGQLTAHEAQQFGKLIESGAKIFETQELLQRIEALETQLSSGHSDDEFVDEKKPGG